MVFNGAMPQTETESESELAARRLRSADAFRCLQDARAASKEWSHFIVFAGLDAGERVDLLINFSVTDGVQTALNRGRAIPRVTLLARSGRHWSGSVQRYASDEVDLRAGRIDARFGTQVLAFRDGAYWIEVADDACGIRARLRLLPSASPLVTPSAPMDGGQVRWLIAPRLIADGTVTVGGRTHELRAAPAYHDHNWGSFHWGGDFSWQWGVVLSARTSAFAIVSRVLDAAGHRVLSDSVVLGGPGHTREFRADEIAVQMEGRCRGPVAFRIPAIMNLAVPDRLVDVPQTTRISAHAGGDELVLEFVARDCAQIGMPNDHSRGGVSLITEVCCDGHVRGVIAGKPVDFDGPAIWETTRVA